MGTLSLYHGEKKVGEGRSRLSWGPSRSPGAWLVRRPSRRRAAHRGLPGRGPLQFTGGTLNRVAINVSGEPYVDLEREAETLLRHQ